MYITKLRNVPYFVPTWQSWGKSGSLHHACAFSKLSKRMMTARGGGPHRPWRLVTKRTRTAKAVATVRIRLPISGCADFGERVTRPALALMT
jgi:hypothetical protein